MAKTVKNSAKELRHFRPYTEYKDSGIEWLGEIPAHWDVQRLKVFSFAQLCNVDKKSLEGEEQVNLCNYTDVYYNEKITPDLEFMAATATDDQVRRFSLRAGDVIITKDSESWNDIAVPAVVIEDIPGVLCGYHLAHIRPGPNCDGNFLARSFAAIGSRDQFQIAANGITRFGLGGDAIRTGVFALPPKKEQRAIAAFIDHETAKIDALVEKKERLIELLKEKRTALITRAVTKGLDPNVPMRDSGIEWLGEIPVHWEIKRLKYLTSINDEALGEDTEPDKEILYVDISNVDRTAGIIKKEQMVFSQAPSRARRIVQDGDVIVSTVRTYLRAITPIIDPEPNLIVSTGFAVIRPHQLISSFAAHVLRATYFVDKVVANSVGVSYPAITAGEIVDFTIAYPKSQEQEEIAAFLDRETAKIDALVDKINEAIDRLKEYRVAIISAAVTGKIDVREEAA